MTETLNQQLITATEQYLQSDKLKEHIDKQAEEMVNDVIRDAFRWKGHLKTQIEDVVKNQLTINIDQLGLQGTNQFLTEALTSKLKSVVRAESATKSEESMQSILSSVDKVISISTIKNKLLEAADTSDLCGCGDVDTDSLYDMGYDESEFFTFIAEEPSGNYDWVTLYFDSKPDLSSYECRYELTVHKERTTYKVKQQSPKAVDCMSDPFKWDIEDLVYSMFLNDSTVNYTEAKELV